MCVTDHSLQWTGLKSSSLSHVTPPDNVQFTDDRNVLHFTDVARLIRVRTKTVEVLTDLAGTHRVYNTKHTPRQTDRHLQTDRQTDRQ